MKTAELSGKARNRRLHVSRNEADEISWTLGLNELKQLAATLNTPWTNLIQEGITEVRIRRGDTYLAGGQITHTEKNRSVEGDTLSVQVAGFLNLFADRYTAALRTFTNVERTTIAATLINESQDQGENWDFGITIGTLATLGVYSRQYQNVRIKDALQDLTKLQLAFDMEFTPDKVFNTYAAIGSRKPSVIFEYPGNVKRLKTSKDATAISNLLYLLGSGIGSSATVQIQQDDVNSQIDYKVREKPIILSDVLDSGTLEDYGLSLLAAWGRAFSIPSIEYSGSLLPVTNYWIGDYVQVFETDDPDTDIQGFYRVEDIDIQIGDEDDEDVKVSFGL
ncbi:hypothetical protein ACFWP5_08755 [Streptomyces sp. NPDC058469]|uniref:hypothetical protein n=1 Tax=Streptomyces sp. NPDC058469 TaxID=3346514 RepID=UPI003665AA24